MHIESTLLFRLNVRLLRHPPHQVNLPIRNQHIVLSLALLQHITPTIYIHTKKFIDSSSSLPSQRDHIKTNACNSLVLYQSTSKIRISHRVTNNNYLYCNVHTKICLFWSSIDRPVLLQCQKLDLCRSTYVIQVHPIKLEYSQKDV